MTVTLEVDAVHNNLMSLLYKLEVIDVNEFLDSLSLTRI